MFYNTSKFNSRNLKRTIEEDKLTVEEMLQQISVYLGNGVMQKVVPVGSLFRNKNSSIKLVLRNFQAVKERLQSKNRSHYL